MANRALEGFEWSTSPVDYLGHLWDNTDFASSAIVADGPNGNAAHLVKAAFQNVPYFRFVLDNQQKWTVGFRFKLVGLVAGANIVQIQDAGTGQVGLQINGDRTLSLYRQGGPVLCTSTYVLPLLEYHYIEIQSLISDTLGTAIIHVDEILVASATNVDTKNTANAYANTISFYSPSNGQDHYIDDIYCNDGTTSYNNDFIGEINVIAKNPNADGDYTDWTPVGGGSHYTEVNRTPIDTNHYVSSQTQNQMDSYQFQDTGAHVVLAVQLMARVEKDNTDLREMALLCRTAGLDTIGSTVTLAQGYTSIKENYDVDPNAGLNWNNFNTAQFGQKVIT